MKEAEIKQLLREYIVSTWLSGDGRDFDEHTDLAQAGILDSFSTLDMASFIDERFQIRLEPSDINADSFRNLGSLTGLVMTRLGSTT